MNIVELKLGEVRPYEKNPRKNDEAVKFVAESIRQFGFKVPIVIDHDGVIVAGHTRYKAAKKLKMETVPCIVADDLTEEQIKAFRLADNKVAEKAEWDFDLLADEMEDLFDFDMTVFGFEEMNLEEAEEAQEDDYDGEVPEEPKSKLGDIYMLGNHRLMCGDSTCITDVEKLMGGEKADIAFSSPPYGAGNNAKLRNHYVPGQEELKSFYNSHEDDIGSWRELINDALTNMMIHSFSQFVNIQMLADNKIDLVEIVNDHKDSLVDIIIWNKSSAPPQMQANVLNNKYEFIFVFDPENNTRSLRYGDFHGNVSNVVEVKKENNEYADIHKAVFPVGLPAEIININSKCKSVLDLFGGTGTTMIACEQLSRKCYMMELDPRYVDVIIDRWEKFTGKEAVLLNEENPKIAKAVV